MKRVVITGIGVRTPLGNTVDELWDGLVSNRTGVVPMPQWAELADLKSLVAAPVTNLDERRIPRKTRRTMGRVGVLAALSAESAVAHAKLPDDVRTGGRTGVIMGSTSGSIGAENEFWWHLRDQDSARGVRSTLFFQAMSHTCATNTALHLGVTGEVMATNSACASSSQAIGLAAERIRYGRADVMLCGGAEELHIASSVVFGALHAATTNFNDTPDLTPRPFDRQRDGIVVGEGAGTLVLESLEHALARGATIYGEVLGHGQTCDASHMSNPSPDGMSRAIELALRDAAMEASDIDYVNAHATGTRAGDAAEAGALHQIVGDRVPVSSSKGHLGHTLGACGVLEAVVSLQAIAAQVAPPTRNLTDPDVAPLWLNAEPIAHPIQRVLSTNFAFGGVNSVLVFGGPPA